MLPMIISADMIGHALKRMSRKNFKRKTELNSHRQQRIVTKNVMKNVNTSICLCKSKSKVIIVSSNKTSGMRNGFITSYLIVFICYSYNYVTNEYFRFSNFTKIRFCFK